MVEKPWVGRRRTDEQFHLSALVERQPCPLSLRYLREQVRTCQSLESEEQRQGEVLTSHVSLVERILRRLLEALIHLILCCDNSLEAVSEGSSNSER